MVCLLALDGLGLGIGKDAVAVEGTILIPVCGAFVGVGDSVVVLIDFAATIGMIFARVGLSADVSGWFTKTDQAGRSFELEGIDAIFVATFVCKVVVSRDKAITILIDDFKKSLVAGKFFSSTPNIAVKAVCVFVTDAQRFGALVFVADGLFAAIGGLLAALPCCFGCIEQHGIRPDPITSRQVSVGSVVIHLDLVGFPVAELVGESWIVDGGVFVDAASDVDLALFAGSAAVAFGVFELVDHRAVSVFCILVEGQGKDDADLFAKCAGGEGDFLDSECKDLVECGGVFFCAICALGGKAATGSAIVGSTAESSGVESAFFDDGWVVSVGGFVARAQKDRLAGLFGKVEKFLDTGLDLEDFFFGGFIGAFEQDIESLRGVVDDFKAACTEDSFEK